MNLSSCFWTQEQQIERKQPSRQWTQRTGKVSDIFNAETICDLAHRHSISSELTQTSREGRHVCRAWPSFCRRAETFAEMPSEQNLGRRLKMNKSKRRKKKGGTKATDEENNCGQIKQVTSTLSLFVSQCGIPSSLPNSRVVLLCDSRRSNFGVAGCMWSELKWFSLLNERTTVIGRPCEGRL